MELVRERPIHPFAATKADPHYMFRGLEFPAAVTLRTPRPTSTWPVVCCSTDTLMSLD